MTVTVSGWMKVGTDRIQEDGGINSPNPRKQAWQRQKSLGRGRVRQSPPLAWQEEGMHKDCPLRCGAQRDSYKLPLESYHPSPKNLKQIPGRGRADETNNYDSILS